MVRYFYSHYPLRAWAVEDARFYINIDRAITVCRIKTISQFMCIHSKYLLSFRAVPGIRIPDWNCHYPVPFWVPITHCGVFVILVLSILMVNMFLYGIVQFNPPMVWPFKTFQNLLTGKMAINMSEPFKTLHNFLLLHYHTFQYPLKGFER